MREIEIGQVATSYARTRDDIPASLMDSLYTRGIFFDGKSIADIGCGTGALTRKMAMRKAKVVGVEPSKDLLENANALNRLKNYTIPYQQGTAEDTGLEGSNYDIVTVMRAWHQFDRPKAIKEIKRILKTKGMLIVIDSMFLSGSATVDKTSQVLTNLVNGGLMPNELKTDSQRINGFPVVWFDEWQKQGFEMIDFYKLNYSVNFTKDEWLDGVESIRLEVEGQNKLRKELAALLPNEESYQIPYACNVCILKLIK
ncbi:class I SAM-dependent methyltransferase [Neobacillus sp. FSL H8-0543]|uniref:class I SAM-dependent methyltransferase n=1 Tax=Neobacillus sp. FSL H8-0543 TaxID=2954672 RepID=UPI00315898EB